MCAFWGVGDILFAFAIKNYTRFYLGGPLRPPGTLHIVHNVYEMLMNVYMLCTFGVVISVCCPREASRDDDNASIVSVVRNYPR